MTGVRKNSLHANFKLSYADTWGFPDVISAIRNIPAWMEIQQWKGLGVDVSKWLVIGHSNGGETIATLAIGI